MAVAHVKHGDTDKRGSRWTDTGDCGGDGEDSGDSGREVDGTGEWPSTMKQLQWVVDDRQHSIICTIVTMCTS